MRLRGHHFLCLLTYKGLGYTPAFVENMTAIATRINAGAKVILHPGPDDICAALTPATAPRATTTAPSRKRGRWTIWPRRRRWRCWDMCWTRRLCWTRRG